MMQDKSSNNLIDANLAREQLWRRGHLSWLLDENQNALYELFHEKEHKIQTWLLARRSGKSYALCVLSIEQCIRQPNSIVKFLSPTKKQVERNIRPLMSQILETCPKDIRPDLKAKDDIYYFANGSEIQMAGSEAGNIDSLRGGFAHICVIDEAQDVTNLPYAINSVLLPTTSTTEGKILLAGTPPTSYDHEFLQYIEQCELEGSLVKRTVYDNPRMSKKEIDIQAKAMGGFTSEDFRREFLCHIIKDSTISVIPEFTEEKALELVKEWPRPVFYFPVTAMDIGYKDWTVVLFGYHDFKADKVIIESEIVTKGAEMYLATLGQQIKDRELTLWVDQLTKENIKVKKRVSDHDLVAINEIKKNTNYQVIFEPADKDDKMVGINFLRNLIKTNKIIIHPSCKTLIAHLKNAKWAKGKELFARCSQGSHYDGVDTLNYLTRAINYKENPYPKDYGNNLRIEDTFYTKATRSVYGKTEMNEKDSGVYKKILGLGNRTTNSEKQQKVLQILNGKVEEIKKKGYFK